MPAELCFDEPPLSISNDDTPLGPRAIARASCSSTKATRHDLDGRIPGSGQQNPAPFFDGMGIPSIHIEYLGTRRSHRYSARGPPLSGRSTSTRESNMRRKCPELERG